MQALGFSTSPPKLVNKMGKKEEELWVSNSNHDINSLFSDGNTFMDKKLNVKAVLTKLIPQRIIIIDYSNTAILDYSNTATSWSDGLCHTSLFNTHVSTAFGSPQPSPTTDWLPNLHLGKKYQSHLQSFTKQLQTGQMDFEAWSKV